MGQENGKIIAPGIVYSEDWVAPREEDLPYWRGSMQHLLEESVPEAYRASLERSPQTVRPSPSDEPYTFWERAGCIPVHPDRLRPRQYYMPTTDFRYWDYDERCPEEIHLKEAWIARLFDYNWQLPFVFFSICVSSSMIFPIRVRVPMMMFGAFGGVMAEAYRVFFAAMRERETLDDFIVAKEMWYIKNVETIELQVPTQDPYAPPPKPRTRVSWAAGDEYD